MKRFQKEWNIIVRTIPGKPGMDIHKKGSTVAYTRNDDQEWEFSSESLRGEGNLTEDPRIISGKGKKMAVVLRVASNSAARNAQGEMVKHVAYRDIKVFGRRAENAAEMFSKGDPIVYEGKLKPKSYINREGEEIKDLELIADFIGFGMLGKPKGDGGGGSRSHSSRRSDDEGSSRSRSRSRSRSARNEEPDYDSDDDSYEDPEDSSEGLDDEAPRSRSRSRSRSGQSRRKPAAKADSDVEDYKQDLMEDIN